VIYFYHSIFIKKKRQTKSANIGQFTRLLRSLELRAVSQSTVLLLWDQKLLLRMRNCFEGSTLHLPTKWLDAADACMTRLQVQSLASLLDNVNKYPKIIIDTSVLIITHVARFHTYFIVRYCLFFNKKTIYDKIHMIIKKCIKIFNLKLFRTFYTY